MSTIQSIWALVGWRSAVRCGTARFSTVRSIEYSMHGRAMTASPIHSRLPALPGISTVVIADIFDLWSTMQGRPRRRPGVAGGTWLVVTIVIAGRRPPPRVGVVVLRSPCNRRATASSRQLEAARIQLERPNDRARYDADATAGWNVPAF
jgi:hypothetical protein